jgi:peptidoglycan/xylan/chitin deacetylase (PgdA/CDA1 family)
MGMRAWARDTTYQFLHVITGPGRGVRVILLYHSVGLDASHSIPLPMFKQQMESLAKRFTVVLLRDLSAADIALPPGSNIAALTFDDGYLDNFECALPVLEDLGLKGTFFVITGLMNKSLRTFAGEHPMMAETHVQQLATMGHEIAAHTISHPKLTKVPPNMVRAEIEESKHCLEDLVGTEISSFAYPKGDYDEIIKQEVAAAGFRTAVTVNEGLINARSDWLELPRVWIGRNFPTKTFTAKTSPATTYYNRLRQSVNVLRRKPCVKKCNREI